MQTLQLESKPGEDGRGQGRGTVKIALCGHSMGGLVAVDAALKIADENALMGEKDVETGKVGGLWPRVVSVIAYDSPVSIQESPKQELERSGSCLLPLGNP